MSTVLWHCKSQTQSCHSQLQKAGLLIHYQLRENTSNKKTLNLFSNHQDQNLGNWQLKRQVGSGAPIFFKFPVKFTLKAGQRVTVSSAFTQQDHRCAQWRTQSPHPACTCCTVVRSGPPVPVEPTVPPLTLCGRLSPLGALETCCRPP